MTRRQSFDRVARLYRWAEYAALGPVLQRVRTHFLPQLHGVRCALALGDGDGRFLAAWLASNAQAHATAVDASAAMLGVLRQRCGFASERLLTRQQSLEEFVPDSQPDLVVTHFVLDCLAQAAVDGLAARIAAGTQPGALWLVSDFGLPVHPVGRAAARVYIRALYLAFRALTGLETQRLPDHAGALGHAGFERVARRQWMGGFLFTELWQRRRDV